MLPAVYRNSSIEWKPSPVVALATRPDHSQVAAAREDGSLEIWIVVPFVGWHRQLNIHGDPRSRVSSLVWCRAGSVDSRCDRLLSSSIDGSISEWDLRKLKQKVVLESISVSIWQISVAPSALRLHAENGRNGGDISGCESGESEFDSTDPNLAVACDDGSVRIYSIPDSGDLIYERKLTTANGRVLSVTWSPDAGLIYSGSSDGFIRCWDVKSGQEKYRITVGLGAVDSGMPICVWSLLALKCGTLVSADSTGSVHFWESRHGTIIQTHSCHNGDANSLAASPSHNRVFSAGSDGQVILYELTMKKWVYVGNARAHTHDIRALTIAVPINREGMLSDQKGKRTHRRRRVFESSYHNWAHVGVPMLISAGDDAKLFAYSEQKFASPHDVCPVPCRLPIQLVCNTVFDNSSLLLVQGSCSLDIYCVRTKSGTRSDMGPGTSKRRATLDLMVRIKAESSRKIICSTISNSGMLFAYSDHTNPNLFELKKHEVGRNQWTVNKMQLPEKLPYALSMIFSSDSSRLMIAGHDRRIYVVDVHRAELVHTLIPCCGERKELSPREHPITKMFISSDSRWLSAVDCIGGIYVFNLETQRQHWFISRLNGASVTAGGFPPQDNNVLVVTTSSNQVYEFDVAGKQLGKWSMQHTSGLPKRFQEFSGEVIGLSFFPKSRTPSVMIYSARAMCLIKFGIPVDGEEDYKKENVQQRSSKKLQSSPLNRTLKRKCEDDQTKPKHKRNFEFYAFRDPALFMGHFSEDSILVIDKPWIDVVKTFDTAPVHRHIYGT